MKNETTRDMLVVDKATLIRPGIVMFNCRSRNIVVLEIEETVRKAVLAPFCASKQVELVVAHPPEEGRILVSLITTFNIQIVSYENGTINKLGSRGAAPPQTNSKPVGASVFQVTQFSNTEFPIAIR